MNYKKRTKPQEVDWHPADIVAALRKKGWSLRKLSTHHGYKQPTALANALRGRWPKGERLIAEAIGISAQEIWPARYRQDKSS
ncbi:MAG: helix-turn-helix transcriptional regulator [Candidatus Competibacter sp.]|jgi:Ner family transcriptional regulator